MLEIRNETIDIVVEREKSNRAKAEKKTVKTAVVLLIVIFLEIFLLVGATSFGILRTLKIAAIFIVFDAACFFIAVESIMKIMVPELPYPAVFSFLDAYWRKRFQARLDAADTDGEKLRLYDEHLKKALGKRRKSSAAVEYMEFLMRLQSDENADELYEKIANEKPKKLLLKFLRLQGMLLYFMLKDDGKGYVRAFEENMDTADKYLNWDLSAVQIVIIYYAQYFEYKKDFQNAVDCCDLLVYLNERSSEVDVSLAMPEESLKALSIDYARLFCCLGRWDEAEKCFLEAKKMFADNNILYIKKQLEAVRKMLEEHDEHNNKLKESDTNA